MVQRQRLPRAGRGSRTGSWAGWCLPSLQHPRPHLEGQPIPTCGLLQGRHSTQHSLPRTTSTTLGPWWCYHGSACPQGGNTTPLGAAAVPSHSCSSCWWPVPTTLLISLCLSLLTISSSTSPSPLMSLQDKQRPRSHEGTGKFLQLQRCWADELPGKASADPPLTLYFVTLFFYQA